MDDSKRSEQEWGWMTCVVIDLMIDRDGMQWIETGKHHERAPCLFTNFASRQLG